MVQVNNDEIEIRNDLVYRLNDDAPFTGILNYFGSPSDYVLELKINYKNGKKNGLTEIITVDCCYTKEWVNGIRGTNSWKRSIDPKVTIQKGTQNNVRSQFISCRSATRTMGR